MPDIAQRPAERLVPPDRRAEVLDAARRLILQTGYSGLTMNAVARSARVTRPVLYEYFANQEDLLGALLEREETTAIAAVYGAAPDLSRLAERDIDDLIVESTEVFLRAVQEAPETWRLVLLPPQGAPTVVRERVEEGRRTVLSQLQMVAALVLPVRGGVAELDLELVAEAIYQFCERSIRLMLTEPDEFPAGRIVALVRQVMAVVPRGGRA